MEQLPFFVLDDVVFFVASYSIFVEKTGRFQYNKFFTGVYE
jgi:hypothetical protein